MAKWYKKQNNDNVHEDIFGTVREIQNAQTILRKKMQRNLALYGERTQMSFANSSYITSDDFNDRIQFNVTQSAVDTIFQKITKNKPRIQFLTEEGNFENQQIAKKLNKFIDGQFYKSNIYTEMPLTFKEAEIIGSGFIKIFRDQKEIKAQKVFAGEIVVDEMEAIYGKTNTMYQVKLMSRETLIDMFPKFANKLLNCETFAYSTNIPRLADNMWVIEAWRLPTDKEKTNGKHAIVVNNCTLLFEDYKKDYFPFVKIDWKKKSLGYLGSSLIDEAYQVQLEITAVARKMQDSFKKVSVPRVFLEAGSEVLKTQLNNEIGAIVWYTGTAPIFQVPQAVDPMLFQHLQFLLQKYFDITGVSILSSQSQKPAGLNSGKALREFSDIESERFYMHSVNYENSFIEAAKIMIDYAQDIAKEFGEYSVMAKNNEGFELIKWSDIQLDETEYVMQPYPTNFFSKTPSGQLQDAIDLVSSGMIDQKTALRIFDFPDVNAVTKYINAPQEIIHKIMDYMIYKNEYISPEPYMDLSYGLSFAITYYNECKMNNVPDERLELIRTWMSAAEELKKQAEQAQMQAQLAAQAQMQPQAMQQEVQGVM